MLEDVSSGAEGAGREPRRSRLLDRVLLSLTLEKRRRSERRDGSSLVKTLKERKVTKYHSGVMSHSDGHHPVQIEVPRIFSVGTHRRPAVHAASVNTHSD